MKTTITLRELEHMSACLDAQEAFEETFGDEASIAGVIAAIQDLKRPDWEAWLLAQTPELTEAMLHHSANVHACDDYALRIAVGDGKIEVVRLLLDHDADVHACGDRALRWAVEGGHTETVRLLLDHDADVHMLYDYALRWARERGNTEIVALLEAAAAQAPAP